MKRAILNALILGSILAACTNDPDNTLDFGTTTTRVTTATTDTTPETTASSTTTIASTTPTDVDPTPSPPATTTSTTTPPPPTNAPTTTIDVESQIRADFEVMLNARLRCGMVPGQCDFAAASITGSPADVSTQQQISLDLAAGNRTIDGEGSYRWRIDGIRHQADTAVVTTCVFDTGIVFAIGDPADPADDTVVNDLQVSKLNDWEMRRVDGQWGLYSLTAIERYEGEDRCGF